MGVWWATYMCTRTHIHTTALFFLWLSAARLRNPTLKVAPSACFPLLPNVICETSCSQGQRHSVSKWDLATSKLSSDSRRKGAWGGSTVQWQGRREIPPPAFMLTVKIDVQWVYENISLFCLCDPWRLEYSTMFVPPRRLDVQASHMGYTQTATLSCMNDD